MKLQLYFFILVAFCGKSILFAQDTHPKITGLSYEAAVNQDFIYNKNIHTVQLYPQYGKLNDQFHKPIIPLNSRFNLMLRFDEIGEEAGDYEAKIYHCNADWNISDIPAIEYLTDYNELNLNDFDFSVNTKVLYTHFYLEIPRIKVSGNYIVKVYEEGKEKKVAFIKRFMVYENLVNLAVKIGNPPGNEAYLRNHQIDFNINHPNFKIDNPNNQVKVTLRQNYRWDNAITKLKPLFIRAMENTLDYHYFDLSNNFKAGNEFRHFNFSSFRGQNFNIKEALDEDYIFVVNLYDEKSNENKVYNRMTQDYNGRFIINSDIGDGTISADYARVVFTLKSQSAEEGDVYIIGGFNNWQLDEKYKMEYLTDKQLYQANILLKQGAYDYAFTLYNPIKKIRNDQKLEGSHRQTENEYDIIVYFKPFGGRGDRIIGYKRIK